MTRSDDVHRAICEQLDNETIYAIPPETEETISQKEDRVEKLSQWVRTLSPGEIRSGYETVLEEAAASLRRWREGMAEDRRRLASVALPALPPELRPF